MGPISPTLYAQYRALRDASAAARPLTREQRRRLGAARRGAKRRGIPFELSERDFEILIARASGRCEMTGIGFSDEPVAGQRIKPFRMSIDRLDNDDGYSLENCRLVCAFANLSRGALTLELAHLLFLEYARNHGAIIPQELVASRDVDRWQY